MNPTVTESMVDSKIRMAVSEAKLDCRQRIADIQLQRELLKLTCQLLTLMLLFSVVAVAVAVAIAERTTG